MTAGVHWFQRLALTLAVILAIAVSGFLSGLVVLDDESLAPLWLPAAVGLTVIIWYGRAAIPGLFIGAGIFGFIVASDWVSDPWQLTTWTLGVALGQVLQSVACAWTVRRLISESAIIESARDYFLLFAIALVIGPLGPIGSIPGQAVSGVWSWLEFRGLFLNWWVGNSVAIAFLTPLLLGLRRSTPLQSATLFLLLVAGLAMSFRIANTAQDQERAAWQSQARLDAEQVTGIFIRALQNGYGDMRALDLVLGTSGRISEREFAAAIDTLERNRDGFAPAALLVARRTATGRWLIEHASDNALGLVSGYELGELEVARDAMDSSLQRGLTLGGTAELLPGRYFGINAIPAPHADLEEPRVVVGIQDVNEIDAIIADQIPFGLGFAISSVHASGLTTEGRDHFYPQGKTSADALVKFDIPMTTGGAELTFHWGVLADYQGGPTTGVGRAVIFGGPLLTMLLVAFLHVMYAQAGRIRRQVNSQTSELRGQREILQATMDSMDQALLMVDGAGEIIAYNLLYLQMFNIDDELISRYHNFNDLIRYVAEDLGDPGLADIRIREARRRDAFTTEQDTPDGRVIETRQNPVDTGGFVRTYTDITERRLALREVERQKTIATQALENMGEGILVVDAEGKVAAYNQLAADYFELSREEVDRYPDYVDLLHYIHTEKFDMPDILQERLKELERNVPLVNDRTLPSGVMLEVRHRPVEGGGFVRVFLDVTDLRKAEEELLQQKSISELALQNMDNGLLLVDGDWQVAAYNPVALDLFGLTEKEIEVYPNYEDLMRYIHREKLRQPELAEERLKQVRRGEAFTDEQHLNDGTIIEVRHYPMEDGGFLRMLDDVTERRNNELKLIAAMEIAEESARSKSEFLANMSHEIRTPMNAIIGMSQLALKTELTARQHNYIDKVHRSAVGLLGIINDILDFSKIEAGKLEIEQVEFRLEEVLDNLVTLVGFRAEEKGLELLLDVAADVPRQLHGDPLRLGQILVNLANNAVKFTEEGEVVVSVRSIERDDQQVQLEFSVRDTGIGMSVEEKARLFKAFSQADASTTRKFGGTGLGLTISKRLVDAMGGEIAVESKPDMGSEFRFTIELGWEEDAGALPTASELELEGLRVLVVDDNPTARTIFNELVSSLGFRADLAASGSEALELAAAASADSQPYDVMLVDWQMPQMDGVETVKAMVERGYHPEVQALLMVTAYGREEASEAVSDLPINNILTKPLNASVLLDAILVARGRDALSRHLRKGGDVSREYMSQLAGAHVLLVEDNDINQELALELLQGAGMTVDIAGHGREALEKLALADYDGVLMDIQMPVMDGYTATERIRSQERFADLPVIAMTANALVGDRVRALEAGMNDHIAKPLNVATMFATLARWITPSSPVPVATDAMVPRPSAALPELAGIDTRAGLATCAGNVELYKKLLVKFLAANSEFEVGFREAHRESTDTATRFAHTLKGTAASVGARELAAAAAELESACREEQGDTEVTRSLQALLDAMAPVLAAIAAADLAPATTPRQAQPGNIPTLVAELRGLLESADTRAESVVRELHSAAGDTAGESLQTLISDIEQFDFDAALLHLAEIEKRFIEVEPQ